MILSSLGILSLTKEFISVVIIRYFIIINSIIIRFYHYYRTAYARVQLKITITSKYPLEAPIVELSSSSLPLPLLRNKV